MQQELLEQLKQISQEEQRILKGETQVVKSLYTDRKNFVIDGSRMLEKGKLIDIRTHTRFVHFPKHSHDYVEIIYMCSGTTTHVINGSEKVVLNRGDLLFLNQNAVHEIYPAKEDDIAVNFIVVPEFFNMTFHMIEEENVIRDFFVGTLQQNKRGGDFIYFNVADILPIQNLIENMIWSLIHKQGNKRNINQTTMGLLILHLANYTERIEMKNPKQYEQNLMFFVLRYIEENYKNGTLTELAGLMNQQITSLSRFIKKMSGSTFQQLLQQKRLNQAVFLLTTTKLTVEEIILAVGYDNTSYFYCIFREKYGMTPKNLREKRNK